MEYQLHIYEYLDYKYHMLDKMENLISIEYYHHHESLFLRRLSGMVDVNLFYAFFSSWQHIQRQTPRRSPGQNSLQQCQLQCPPYPGISPGFLLCWTNCVKSNSTLCHHRCLLQIGHQLSKSPFLWKVLNQKYCIHKLHMLLWLHHKK